MLPLTLTPMTEMSHDEPVSAQQVSAVLEIGEVEYLRDPHGRWRIIASPRITDLESSPGPLLCAALDALAEARERAEKGDHAQHDLAIALQQLAAARGELAKAAKAMDGVRDHIALLLGDKQDDMRPGLTKQVQRLEAAWGHTTYLLAEQVERAAAAIRDARRWRAVAKAGWIASGRGKLGGPMLGHISTPVIEGDFASASEYADALLKQQSPYAAADALGRERDESSSALPSREAHNDAR